MRNIFIPIILALFVLISCDSQKKTTVVPDSSTVSLLPADAPEWYRQLPQSPEYIYGKGMSRSKRMTIAREKAMLLAQTDLAQKINKDSLTGKEIELTRGIVKEQHSVQEGGRWRVYVLMEMPKNQDTHK